MNNITLTLTRAEAQTILDALAGQPYAQVYQLIPKLMDASRPAVVTSDEDDAEDAAAS